jgi:CubicO group peptidase (beta-lactamase class C family)
MFGRRWSILRTAILPSLALLSCNHSPTAVDTFEPPALSDGWPVSAVEEQGFNRTILNGGYVAAAALPYTRSLLVVRNGFLVAEQYFNGNFLGNPNDAMSISKSILSGLLGIALQKRYLDSLNQRMIDFFPEYISPSLDPRISDITIRHLLMMRAGFDNDQATYFQVYGSSNWVKTTLELPLLYGPGEKMSYNTFEAHLLSVILTRATHLSTREFAQEILCKPLGITIASWETDPQGNFFGGNGMRFSPRDLARFGLLYLQGGNFHGKQIIPREWIEESLTNFTQWQDLMWGDVRGYNYGYFWWMGDLSRHRIFFALGHGGQLIIDCPELDLVVVSTADPDFDWGIADEHERAIMHIIAQYVMPAVSN